MRTAVAAVAVCALALAPGCALANRMAGVTEARAIQATGERADALVLDLWDTGITLNDDPVVGLKVRVQRTDGGSYEATIAKSLVSRVHVPQVQPGSTVPVFVDRADPTRVALGLYDLRR